MLPGIIAFRYIKVTSNKIDDDSITDSMPVDLVDVARRKSMYTIEMICYIDQWKIM